MKELTKEWIEEAERRYQAYKEGKIVARPAEEVIRDLRARLKQAASNAPFIAMPE